MFIQSFSVPQVKRPRLTKPEKAKETNPDIITEIILQSRRQRQGQHQTETHTEYQSRIFEGKILEKCKNLVQVLLLFFFYFLVSVW